VKGIALILSLLIFSTSVKASSFVMGLSGAIQGVALSYSCCQKDDLAEVDFCDDRDQSQEQKDKGCCEGNNCDCTCCLHMAFMINYSTSSNVTTTFSEVKFDYAFLYHADYLNAVFHPPTIS